MFVSLSICFTWHPLGLSNMRYSQLFVACGYCKAYSASIEIELLLFQQVQMLLGRHRVRSTKIKIDSRDSLNWRRILLQRILVRDNKGKVIVLTHDQGTAVQVNRSIDLPSGGISRLVVAQGSSHRHRTPRSRCQRWLVLLTCKLPRYTIAPRSAPPSIEIWHTIGYGCSTAVLSVNARRANHSV